MLLTFLTLFNRPLTSFLPTLSLAILFYISCVKSNILGKPLTGEDFIFLSHLDKSTLSLLSSYINPIAGLFALVAFILIFSLSAYFESRFFSEQHCSSIKPTFISVDSNEYRDIGFFSRVSFFCFMYCYTIEKTGDPHYLKAYDINMLAKC